MEYTSKSVIAWLYCCLAGVVAMVLLGGLTRLSDSGLSITEWDVFRGAIPPLNELQWQEWFEKYKQIPEYAQINPTMGLQEFKEIFWLEFLHRLMGRIVGFVFFVPFAVFWARGMLSKFALNRILLIGGLGALQGFFGWYMVQSGLSERVDVSHFRLAMHLLTAFLIFALLLQLLLKLKDNFPRETTSPLYPASQWLIFALFFMCMLGAFVAGTDAGFIYTNFPLMGDSFVPADIYAMQPWWLNHLENQATIQFQHRIFAYILVVAIGFFAFLLYRFEVALRPLAIWLALALLLQVALGISTLHLFSGLEEYFAANGYKKIFQPAVIVAQLHQLGALFMLGVSVVVAQRLRGRG